MDRRRRLWSIHRPPLGGRCAWQGFRGDDRNRSSQPERLTPKAGCSISRTMEVCDESAEVGVDRDLAGAHRARERSRGAGRPGVRPPGKGRLKDPGSDIVPRRAVHVPPGGGYLG